MSKIHTLFSLRQKQKIDDAGIPYRLHADI